MALPPLTKKQDNLAKIITAVILFIFMPAGCVYLFNGMNDPAATNKMNAIVCAEQEVRRKLKAPSTAEFSYISDMTIETSDNINYKISSYVDSQNSFGAMMRMNFTCDIQLQTEAETCTSQCLIDE